MDIFDNTRKWIAPVWCNNRGGLPGADPNDHIEYGVLVGLRGGEVRLSSERCVAGC
jgi:hypothetical protein